MAAESVANAAIANVASARDPPVGAATGLDTMRVTR